MRFAFWHDAAREMSAGSLECKSVSDLQGGWQITFQQDFLNCGGGIFNRPEACRDGSPGGGEREQSHRRLSHHSQHSFGADEESDEIESGFVLVSAAANPDYATTG